MSISKSALCRIPFDFLEPEAIDYIPPETFYDFGFDLFPLLLSKGAALYGYVTTDTILDAGTIPERVNPLDI